MTLEELGAILGLVAFVGLAVLIFMTFQQARHLRRLRDWAGRAPERAAAVADRAGEDTQSAEDFESEEIEPDLGPSFRERMSERYGERWAELDRRMPIEPKLLFGGLAAIAIGLVIALSLGGGDSAEQAADGGGGGGGGGGNQQESTPREQKPPKVAVLNGTSPPVAGIADRVAGEVKAAGFRTAEVENAPAPVPVSVVMFKGDADADAGDVADDLTPALGPLEVIPMTPEVEALLGGTDLAVVVGTDDAAF